MLMIEDTAYHISRRNAIRDGPKLGAISLLVGTLPTYNNLITIITFVLP
jgi:hypothetical protein